MTDFSTVTSFQFFERVDIGGIKD